MAAPRALEVTDNREHTSAPQPAARRPAPTPTVQLIAAGGARAEGPSIRERDRPGQRLSPHGSPPASRGRGMPSKEIDVKVKPSVKKICDNCKIIRRKGAVRVICTNPRHKQKQG